MPGDNELKPVDLSAKKSATSRIDLSKATVPASPSTSGIRIGTNPKKATSRIDISAIPGASKPAAPTVSGIGAMPPQDDDIYKRRTALLDTSKIPLNTKPAAQPRTIRIGGRPTVRVTSSGAPATFSPGRTPEPADSAEEAAPAAAPSGRPTIRLKRPGGGASVTISGGESPASSSLSSEPLFTIQEDDSPGALWAVVSLLSTLVLIGLVVFQFMTMNGAKY